MLTGGLDAAQVRTRNAHHEAGHAVIGMAEGLPVMDTRGWFTFLEAAHGESLGSCLSDLACPLMSLPEHVAAEVAHLCGGAPAVEPIPGLEEPGREWRAPHGYVLDPPVTGDPTDVILDLERSLSTYLTHPDAGARQAA